ncbi:MAG TPA: ectonucleotide pyrophosphatase/phosphodiesterase [Kofleriaceae bacterium]|nr:ectonucleotide pyrophosphatase/phosphodiesterase [Kofleriaceae bacterium]
MRFAVLCALLVACTPSPRDPGAVKAPLPGRVVVISIDGMMPDVYLDPDAHGLRVPTLRALVAGGAAGRVHGVMPTVTYPSHTTLVTGVPPRVHGIVGNTPLDPLGKNQHGWFWYAEDIKVPTLYEAVEAAHGIAALVIWPVAVGAHASIVVPEYWRAGTRDDQKLLRALSTPGVLDEVAAASPDLWQYLTPNEIKDHAQIEIARDLIAHRHPDLVLIHIFELDDAQHAHGPWSPEAKAVLEAADREVAALLADLQASPDWPRTTLFVVSDHGFAPVDHEIHLGALLVAHGLVRLAPDGKPSSADVGFVAAGGSALFYLLDPSKRGALDDALAELGDHVARRIDHDALVALGGDPAATFALVAAPGNAFSDQRTGEVVEAVSPRGTHGWPPDDPAMAASLIAYGPHVPHVALGTIDMLDIAPTMARLLGVALPSAIGKPIEAIVH